MNEVKWVNVEGNPALTNRGETVNDHLNHMVELVVSGEVIGDVDRLLFRDPNSFVAGQLHEHLGNWESILKETQSSKRCEVWDWIENKVSIFPYFSHFKGRYKGKDYDSDRPPRELFRNNLSCKNFVEFIRKTLLARLKTGAISLVGRVEQKRPPFLVLPLVVEPSKPRLCHDARFLNLWMMDKPFKLDRVVDAPRYVSKNSYQTVLDDKSGYDHVLLSEDSRTFFGIQWGGWYFTYNTLPFGWKISPYVYHSIGLTVSNYLRTLGIPCLLYIDDRHNGQLQVDFGKGEYDTLETSEMKNLAAAKSAIFLAAFYLVRLGYFLGLSKSILRPRQVVPYLGFLIDSKREVFNIIPEKRRKFLELIEEILKAHVVSVKTLQRLAGKCVSFALVVPAARLYTREMNLSISKGLRSQKMVYLSKELRDEITHWLFLKDWDSPMPWREEKHLQIELSTDASQSGWGGTLVSPMAVTSDYWTADENPLDIACKEALAIEKVLRAFQDKVRDKRVDVMVDNQTVIYAWNNQGCRNPRLNDILKVLFSTTVDLNILLRLVYIPTHENPADAPSRRLSFDDCTLSPYMWGEIQKIFGDAEGHTCDLMALDTNAMRSPSGVCLPHFTPYPSAKSLGVNLFAQELDSHGPIMERPYVFPPQVLVGPVLRFLQSFSQSCTIVVLDTFPRKYWWPILQRYSTGSCRMAYEGDKNVLLLPSRTGWVTNKALEADLWAFKVQFL